MLHQVKLTQEQLQDIHKMLEEKFNTADLKMREAYQNQLDHVEIEQRCHMVCAVEDLQEAFHSSAPVSTPEPSGPWAPQDDYI